MASRQQGMRIAELARRSGTTKETIHFYLREGLLRKPKKTSRNMAYYDETHLEQLKLIKRLRTESYLPLTVIKQVMKDGKLATSARHLDLAGDLFGQGARAEFEPLSKEALAERSGLSPERIAEYEESKLLRPTGDSYGYEDVRIAEILHEAEVEAGEGAEQLVRERFEILERHMSYLVREEVQHFFSRILGEGDPRNVLEVLQGGRETIGRFMGAARARRLREEVEAMMPAIEGVMNQETEEPFLFPLLPEVRAASGEAKHRAGLSDVALLNHLADVGDHPAAVEVYGTLKERAQADPQVRIRLCESLIHVRRPDEAYAIVERLRQELTAPDCFAEALWGSLCLIRVRRHFAELESSTELIGYLSRAFSAYDAARSLAAPPQVEARARMFMARVLLVTPEFLGARPQGQIDLVRTLACIDALRHQHGEAWGFGALEYLEGNALEFMSRAVPEPEASAYRSRARAIIAAP